MGRWCGFYFYKFENGKLIDMKVPVDIFEGGPSEEHDLFICGRCEATDAFSNMFFEVKPNLYTWPDSLKPEDKFTPYLLMNHPELDNYEVHKTKGDPYYKNNSDWFCKYFYVGLDAFEKSIKLDEVEKEHNDIIQSHKDDITRYENEIESLRCHQEKAETKAAFDGFERSIRGLRCKISEAESSIKYYEKDDYDYEKYMLIKNYVEIVEELIRKDPDLVVAAYFSD